VRDGALRDNGRDRAPAPARHGRDSARGSERLARDIARGITPEEGLEAFECALETSAREGARGARIAISSMDLEALRAHADHEATAHGSPDGGFERPDLDTAFTPPADALERAVAALFEGLLGIARVGRDDSFFDLGGHSLVAVRLFAKIRKQWGVELPLASIFDAPTVATTAALLRARGLDASEDSAPATRAERASGPAANASPSAHLVRLAGPRGPAADAVPLVVVAGMFGNVLNLRQLAEWVGKDRPVYGLQARGVRGAESPHEHLEGMARDYLVELKTHLNGAPYLLAGFSGGGLTAYEMAQQLKAGGAPVPWLGLLDTPLPRRPAILLRHRWEIRRIELSERSVGELARWMGRKIERLAASLLDAARGWWHRAHAQPRLRDDEPPWSEAARSERIGAAFRRAAEGYALMPYSGPVTLFRPRPRPRWVLRDGVRVDLDRHTIEADNGWTPWVASLEVLEVPGDHDSMVLAPHVRVVGEAFRARLDAASRELESASSGPRHDDASGTRSSPALRLTSAPLSEPRARADGA
jgi:thioesterase domain-containing protein/acyl carrier protein